MATLSTEENKQKHSHPNRAALAGGGRGRRAIVSQRIYTPEQYYSCCLFATVTPASACLPLDSQFAAAGYCFPLKTRRAGEETGWGWAGQTTRGRENGLLTFWGPAWKVVSGRTLKLLVRRETKQSGETIRMRVIPANEGKYPGFLQNRVSRRILPSDLRGS